MVQCKTLLVSQALKLSYTIFDINYVSVSYSIYNLIQFFAVKTAKVKNIAIVTNIIAIWDYYHWSMCACEIDFPI